MTRWCLLSLLLIMTACGGSTDSSADAATGGDGDAAPGAADAAPGAADAMIGPDAAPPTACEHEVVATGPMCHAECDARLSLPDGTMRWCTNQCGTDSDCTVYSSTLTCPTEVGACMPRCTSDASCQAMGLPRCHPVGNFCDTIPACSTNAQCMGLGLTRCVMPGAYCE